MRRQVKKHEIDYPALNGEAGVLRDPTRKRLSWAPHAVLIDRGGRILRTYGIVPSMVSLREDLLELVQTGLVRRREGDGWREFAHGAWIDVRIEGQGAPRTERQKLKYNGPFGATLRIGKKTTSLERGEPELDVRRYERKPEVVEVDGRSVKTRVFDAVWKQKRKAVEERSWISGGALVRRVTTETSRDGKVRRTWRLLKWEEVVAVERKKVPCRVVHRVSEWPGGRAEERIWLADEVPGGIVKRVRRTRSGGESNTERWTVVAFGLR